MKFTSNYLKSYLKRRLDRLLFLENWNVIILKQGVEDFLHNPSLNSIIYRTRSSFANFFADPFMVIRSGKMHIFMEKYDQFLKRGLIVRQDISLDESGVEKCKKVSGISKNLHLSFPCTLEKDGKLYIIPECIKSGRIAIYELNLEANHCELANILLDNARYVDISVHKKDGIYYIFASRIEGYKNTQLDIFYTDDILTGKLSIHPKSPIRSGNYGSRMAGNLFEMNGKLMRPGQFSHKTYGDGMCIYSIKTLTKDAYEEYVTHQICGEDFGFDGLHTFSVCGDYIAIDVKKHSYNWRKLITKLHRISLYKYIYRALSK